MRKQAWFLMLALTFGLISLANAQESVEAQSPAVSTPAPAPAPVTPPTPPPAATPSAQAHAPAAKLPAGKGGEIKIQIDDTWDGWPGKFSQYIGYESGGTSVIGRNVIVYGQWHKDVNDEFFFGFSKAADSASSTESSTSDTTSSTTVSTHSGAKNPFILALGYGRNWRLAHPNKWINIYGGFFGGVAYATPTSYDTGSTTTTTPDTTNPGNYSVTQTGVGSVSQKSDPALFLGAKAGSEFYLKWFPNLALGFSTGIVTAAGGGVTQTTTTSSGTDTYTGGVKATPSPVQSTTTTTKSYPGLSANTFGLGGTQFQLVGVFSLRYVW